MTRLKYHLTAGPPNGPVLFCSMTTMVSVTLRIR